MKKLSRPVLALAILIATFSMSSAAFTAPLSDLYVDEIDGLAYNTGQLLVQDQTAACAGKQFAYFQFDGTNIATVTSASLILTHGATLNGIDSNPVLSLYEVPYYNPATIDGSNNPEPSGERLASVTIPSDTTQGTKITFEGDALERSIQAQANTGNHIVSFALSFSSSCHTLVTQVNFYSTDYTQDVTRRPALTVEGTKKIPNAVDMGKASAEPVSWPLYAGLGVAALFVVAGVVITRRRTA